MKSQANNTIWTGVSFEESLLRLRTVHWHQQDFVRKRYKLKPDEFNIILHLLDHKNQRMRDLGDRFKIKLSTLTSLVDKIEKAKYVRRENSTKDRRVVYLQLTEKGKRLCDNYFSYLKEISARMRKLLNEDQLKVFVEGTKKLEESIKLTEEL